MSPRVSVVMPTFQNVAFVEATIESVLGQTFTDFNLLISDHSSTDGTWQVLQRFATNPRVTLWQTEPGGGAPANWAAVTSRATGEFVKLVCGDDLLRPRCLQEQVQAMDAHPSVVLVCARREVIDAQGRVVFPGRGSARISGLHNGRWALRQAVRAGTNIFGEPAAVLMRRRSLEAAGGWWADFPYVIDEATYARVLLDGDLYAVDAPLAAFRLSSGQWSVALAASQSAQVIAFHEALAAGEPGLLSPHDLARGAFMAKGLSLARRLVYLALARRLTPKG
ncbi:MAG: glycosyltransferase [Candidatus Phosphoribacter sp.]